MKRVKDNCTEDGNLHPGFWKSLNVIVTTESPQAFVISKPDGYDERGFCSTNTLNLCNWQPWVITACTTGKLHKREKTQQTIVKHIIPYHGVCSLSDKACVDSLRAASTHCLYSATDILLLAGNTKSILNPCLA